MPTIDLPFPDLSELVAVASTLFITFWLNSPEYSVNYDNFPFLGKSLDDARKNFACANKTKGQPTSHTLFLLNPTQNMANQQQGGHRCMHDHSQEQKGGHRCFHPENLTGGEYDKVPGAVGPKGVRVM